MGTTHLQGKGFTVQFSLHFWGQTLGTKEKKGQKCETN